MVAWIYKMNEGKSVAEISCGHEANHMSYLQKRNFS